MRKCFFALVWTALTMQAAPISGLPTISVTAATGQAFWGSGQGSSFPGIVSADLAGSSFTLGFGDPYPQYPGNLFAFDITQGEDIFGLGSNGLGRWELASSINPNLAPGTPSGTVVVNGANVSVEYADGPFVLALASTIVPSDVETVSLPAVLMGDVSVCEADPLITNCADFNTPDLPVFVANVDFDVPGSLTVNFMPGSGPGLTNEYYTVTFTPGPEPRGLLTVPAALLLIGLLGRARSVSCAARRSS